MCFGVTSGLANLAGNSMMQATMSSHTKEAPNASDALKLQSQYPTHSYRHMIPLSNRLRRYMAMRTIAMVFSTTCSTCREMSRPICIRLWTSQLWTFSCFPASRRIPFHQRDWNTWHTLRVSEECPRSQIAHLFFDVKRWQPKPTTQSCCMARDMRNLRDPVMIGDSLRSWMTRRPMNWHQSRARLSITFGQYPATDAKMILLLWNGHCQYQKDVQLTSLPKISAVSWSTSGRCGTHIVPSSINRFSMLYQPHHRYYV